MSLAPEHVRALKALARGRKPAALKRLFAAIRAHDDRTLLAAIKPRRRRPAAKPGDTLGRELQQIMKPLLAPAAEKAELLVEHMARQHRRKLAFAPRGLGEAAKQLRRRFSDEEIRAGAEGLMSRLARLHGDRETVV
jgi:signal transduction histidine kinase